MVLPIATDYPESAIIVPEFLEWVRSQYRMNWHGLHGYQHWLRVRENGLRLAEMTGAKPELVEFFAFLHDIRRRNDGLDPWHGRRAAKLVDGLAGNFLKVLSAEEREQLKYAIIHHSSGKIEAHINIQICWDSDRLDLGRVKIYPDTRRLCTDAARCPEIITWAYERSVV